MAWSEVMIRLPSTSMPGSSRGVEPVAMIRSFASSLRSPAWMVFLPATVAWVLMTSIWFLRIRPSTPLVSWLTIVSRRLPMVG